MKEMELYVKKKQEAETDISIPETPEEVVSDADSNALLRSFADEVLAGVEQAADASHS